MKQVKEWLLSPSAKLLQSTERHLETLERVVLEGKPEVGKFMMRAS